MTAINWDQEIYLPVYGATKDHNIGVYETGSAGWSKKSLCQDIVDGQLENIIEIIYLNPIEGSCRVVTDDIADEVREKILSYGHNGLDWLPPLVDDEEFRDELKFAANYNPVAEHGTLHRAGCGV